MADETQAAEKPQKPTPRPSPESVPYWEAAAQHKLRVQQCHVCGKHWFPPSQRCPHCTAADFAWVEVSGKGKVYSFVVFERVYHPAFEGEVPYVVALVELAEGPRLLTNVVGIAPDKVRCEMPVKVLFDDVAEGVAVPKFTPA
ncbi:MAG TPA: Zn-ribbon domain-containing OB-fold protein [Alphaproteobacteria bacterium]|jgi:hypothetical protein